jgi:hypothetical protein
MRRYLCSIVLASFLGGAPSVFADVTGIRLTFGGGCVRSNSSGGCTLKARASGFDLSSERFILFNAPDSKTN